MRHVVLCICCIIGLYGVAAGAESPQFAITEVQSAIDTRDMRLFEDRVETQTLLQQGVDVFQNKMLKSHGSSLPPALALMAVTATTPQAQEMLRALLTKEARNFVRYGIESGHFAGKPVPGVKPSGLVAPLLNDASLGRKQLTVTGKPVPDGEGVRLPCALKDFGNDRTYALDLRLKRINNTWRVVGVNNLDQLVNRLSKEIGNQ